MNNRTWKKGKHADGLMKAGRLFKLATVGLISVGLIGTAAAGPREQAKRIHDRLAGVPPTEAVLSQMEASIATGPAGALAAANLAMEDPNFYNVTLKNFAAPWTNREGSVFVPLNDYIATVIGMIRDDKPFNTLFSANILYVGPGSLPPYSNNNNNHYQAMEDQSIDMKAGLQEWFSRM
jgi:hypothetical protein